MSEAILETIDLGKKFGGVQAVCDVNLRVQKGQMVAIIGPNGAGKSTLFNLISGDLAPSSGKILYFGKNRSHSNPTKLWKEGLSRTFQIASVFPHLTLRQNIQCALLAFHGDQANFFTQSRTRFRDEANAILEQLGLFKKRDELAGEISYGDQRILDLGIAIASQPRLLLMDEPTQGIAVEESRRVLGWVRDRVKESNMTVIFTEHDLEVIMSVPDKVVVLKEGRLFCEGTPREVFENEEIKRLYS